MGRGGKTAIRVGLVIACLVALAIPPTASAAPTGVTIKLTDDRRGVKGRVKSPVARCVRNRRVKVQATQRGFYRQEGRTTRRGRYRLNGPGARRVPPLPAARYFVTVFRKQGCRSAKSRILRMR